MERVPRTYAAPAAKSRTSLKCPATTRKDKKEERYFALPGPYSSFLFGVRVLSWKRLLRHRRIGGLRRAACRDRRDAAPGAFGRPGIAPARDPFRRCARRLGRGGSARRPSRNSTRERAGIRESSRRTCSARNIDCPTASGHRQETDRARWISSAVRRFASGQDWDPARASLSTGSS